MLIESDDLASLINASGIDKDRGVKIIKSDVNGNYKFSLLEKEWSLIAYNDNVYRQIKEV